MVGTNNLIAAGSFPIGVGRMLPQDDLALHRHDNLELVIVTGGAGLHLTRDGRYPLARGDVFVVPVDMAHGYGATESLRLINVVYDPSRLELPVRRLAALPGYHALFSVEPRLRRHQDFAGHLRVDERRLSWLEGVVDELHRELRERAAGWEQSAAAWLLQILIRLARLYATQQDPAARTAVRLGGVLSHIDSHLHRPVAIDRLCAIGGVSRSTLQRSFRALFGMSVAQHLIRRRMDAARELLSSSDLAIADIAKRVGVDDANYFSRLFTRVVGCTPRSFRSAGPPARAKRSARARPPTS
ncbi:MAG: helix-turn-helix domain-containing protein [Planctomycetes bacterium]|nr:helix-turn-helix domain-containing protein [Planctomycetota bacterium]